MCCYHQRIQCTEFKNNLITNNLFSFPELNKLNRKQNKAKLNE